MKEGRLYAIGLKLLEDGRVAINTLRKGAAHVERVTLLDGARSLPFQQTEQALVLQLPREAHLPDLPYALRVEGSLASFA